MADSKTFTRAEVAAQAEGQTVFIIDNVVYDVAAFLDEHPGGHEVLQQVRGKDASEEFHDVGHSFDAKELMRKFVIGELAEAERTPERPRTAVWSAPGDAALPQESPLASWKVPVLAGLLLTLLYTYLFS